MPFTPRFPWFPYVDIYITRNKLLQHIIRSIPFAKGRLLDVGCGTMPYKNLVLSNNEVTQYIGMDLKVSDVYAHITPDLYWDGYTIPLADETVETVLLTEVLEHCPEPDKVLSEVKRVLRPGGRIIFSVPFIWYLHEVPWDFYRYTPLAMQRLFGNLGLKFDVLETYGGATLSLLHTYLIWLKRNSLPKPLRFALYLATLPGILIALALRIGRKNSTQFKDGHLFIGIVGIATK